MDVSPNSDFTDHLVTKFKSNTNAYTMTQPTSKPKEAGDTPHGTQQTETTQQTTSTDIISNAPVTKVSQDLRCNEMAQESDTHSDVHQLIPDAVVVVEQAILPLEVDHQLSIWINKQ